MAGEGGGEGEGEGEGEGGIEGGREKEGEGDRVAREGATHTHTLARPTAAEATVFEGLGYDPKRGPGLKDSDTTQNAGPDRDSDNDSEMKTRTMTQK